MPYGLYISAEGAKAQSRRIEVLANNLANVDTTGFKRDLAVFQARFAEETQRGLDFHGSGTINDLGGGIVVRATDTDFTPGPLSRTDIETDLALPADGFFVIEQGGNRYLTRAGNFVLNSAGGLETQDGNPVLDSSGAPLAIDPELGPWLIDSNGTVQQAGTPVGEVAIVRPRTLADLAKVGDNLYRPLGEVQPLPIEERRVIWKHLERSGVSPTTEMMELIEASRAFEANVNLIRHQDQMLGSLVNRVMRTNG